MTENFSTDIKVEGQPAFPTANEGNDTSPGSSTGDETNGDQNPSGEGDKTSGKKDDAGFADHPRWKQREEDWTKRFNEQEQRHVQALEEIRREMQGLKPGPAAPKDGEVPKMPNWFGGDEEQWKSFLEWNSQLVSDTEKRVRANMTQEQQQEQQRVDEATKFFESEVAALETDKTLNPTGEPIDRNALLKTALDNDLIDSKGRWNYRAAFRILASQQSGAKTEKNKDRKELAAATTSGNKPDGNKSKNVATSADFKKPGARPW